MAFGLWSRAVPGTKLSLAKEFGRAVKNWRDVLQQTFLKKAPTTKLHPGRFDTCLSKASQPLLSSTTSTFSARVFNSLIKSSAVKLLSQDVLVRSMQRVGGRSRHLPLFSLVGICLGFVDVSDDNVHSISRDSQNSLSEIKESLGRFCWEPEQLTQKLSCLEDLHINKGKSLGRGSDGVIFEAKIKDNSHFCQKADVKSEDCDLAVKGYFNYRTASNDDYLMGCVGREMITLQSDHVPGNSEQETSEQEIPKPTIHLPPHPNIIEILSVFPDNVLVTEEGMREYTAAMPCNAGTGSKKCFGKSETIYLIMKKATCDLETYLKENPEVSMATRCFLLAQLLEGVAHMTTHGVAHRDLKSNNILVDLSRSKVWPRLLICDLGHCLPDPQKKLMVPFPNDSVDRGGNPCLMAPEISTALPGPGSYLNFQKSDLWAVGTIAYQILGAGNPFHGNGLMSGTYREEDLPALPDGVPDPVNRLVKDLLLREPSKRPSASLAAAVVQIVLLSFNKNKRIYHKIPILKCFQLDRGGENCKVKSWNNLPLMKEEQLFGQILIYSLVINCFLKLSKCLDQTSMEIINGFIFLSHLTLLEFKAAMKYF